MQVEIVTAKFNGGVHGYSFSPNGLDLKKNDMVIVETDKGKDIARITREKELVDAESLSEPLKNVVKMADEKEIEMAKENLAKVKTYLPDIKEMVRKENLDMSVVSIECNYNLSRMTVNFMAEERVDFRDLVKKLAEKYKTRIELRQIGPRDRARIIGGLGICGKECCCSQGFGINDHVSIKMAKNQGLSLNPSGISGTCGKLLCCLAYENPYYVEVLKEMPKVGAMVKTPDGEGKVMYNDLIKKTVSVKFQTENTSEIKSFALEDVKFNKAGKNE